jgi:pSer/pThr/pTyr-binding forkhead associated (FHA) protein
MSNPHPNIPFLSYGDSRGARHLIELDGERFTVGRERDNDLALTWDPEASRLHAVLEKLGGSWTVVDDQISRNGTFVNGARLHGRRRLNDHDLIRFGATEVLFRDPSGTADETAPASTRAEIANVSGAQHRVLASLCRPLADPREAGVAPSNREIADELVVSVEAVRSHMKVLFKLFEVPDLPQNRKRAELAKRALATGVILPKDLAR